MPTPPTFFFSYAQGDAAEPGNLVARFFYDLELRTARWAGADPRDQNKELGTFDQRLKQGSDWKRKLADRLKTDQVFVLLLSPLYFRRPNCGRELAAFIQRFPKPYVDSDGCLRMQHAENILAIRWMEEKAYAEYGVPNEGVPALLRSVEWKPASGGDTQLDAAITRYQRRGMEGCVSPGRTYYKLLLNAFAHRMKEMPSLNPAAFEPDLENGDNAFTADWLKPRNGGQVQSTTPVVEPMGPGALVATYITNQPLPLDPRPVKFVDNLVDEATWPAHPEVPDVIQMQELLGAVRFAAVLERLQVFQCTCKLETLDAADRLTRQLEVLAGRNVLTALVVDPAVWQGRSVSPVAPAVEAVVLS